MNSHSKLSDLRASFLASTTQSMPIAGMIFWTIVGIAALRLGPNQLAYLVLFGSGMIFPFGVLLDRMTGRTMKLSDTSNPVMQLFLQSLALVALVWPFVIFAAQRTHDANFIVLGGAILMGIIWIPYGWAADDPVGLQHAIGRSILCYLAYFYAPNPFKATAISIAVVLAYLYSFIRMRRPKSEPPVEREPRTESVIHQSRLKSKV